MTHLVSPWLQYLPWLGVVIVAAMWITLAVTLFEGLREHRDDDGWDQ